MRRLLVAGLAAAALLIATAPAAPAASIFGSVSGLDEVHLARIDWNRPIGDSWLVVDCPGRAAFANANPAPPSVTELPPRSPGGSWCLTSVGALAQEFTFQIDDGAYVLYGYTKVPVVGANEARCEIRRSGSATPVADSPYVCSARFAAPESDNPQPAFTVERKGVHDVSDSAVQRALFGQLCVTRRAVCHFATPNVEAKVAKPQSTVWLVGPFANCSRDAAEVTFSHALSQSATSSIDVTLKGGVELFEFFKIEISAKVGLEWESSHEYTSTQSFEIEPGAWGGLQLIPAVDVVSGDVEIISAAAIYRLKNVRIELPPRAYQATGSFPGTTKVVSAEAGVRCPASADPHRRVLRGARHLRPGVTVRWPGRAGAAS